MTPENNPYPGIPASRTPDVERCINDVLTPDFIRKNGGTREKAMDVAIPICINSIKKTLKGSVSMDKANTEILEAARWTRAFINSLPNGAFAYVEPCYGKTTQDKNARHLPFKDKGGKIDLPHLRNALARMNQIKPICPDTSKETAIRTATRKLRAAAKSAGIGEFRKNAQKGMAAHMAVTSVFIPEKMSQLDANKFLLNNGYVASKTEKSRKKGFVEYPQVDDKHILKGSFHGFDGYTWDAVNGIEVLVAKVEIPKDPPKVRGQ